ncbi:HTH domain-containing protein [Enterococcus olivae]
MRAFLDSNCRRKVELLILLNKENDITFNVLSRSLGVSRPTILRDLEEIQTKFNEWQVTEAAIAIRKTTVYLIVKENFSIHQIVLNYLNENLRYQALVEIFHFLTYSFT